MHHDNISMASSVSLGFGVAQDKRTRDVGLMLIDTSRPGWTVLHADCSNPRIDGKQGEQHSLWDLFKVPDVVSSASEFKAI